VVILGGGLAGLCLAYELKKRGVPFLVLEGGPRFGGRLFSAYSSQNFLALKEASSGSNQTPPTRRASRNEFASHLIGELGGEWFSPYDPLLSDLARELKIYYLERPNFWNPMNGGITSSDWSRLKVWMRSREYTVYQSLPEALFEFSRDVEWSRVASTWAQIRFGVPAEEVQARVWAQNWAKGPAQARSPWAHMTARFREGSSHLVSRLQNSVQSIRADEFLRTQHRLIEVRVRSIPQTSLSFGDASLDLFFETSGGRLRIPARRVVSTLPLGALKEVRGIELFMDVRKAEQLGWGQKIKSLLHLNRTVPEEPRFISGAQPSAVWRSSEPSARWITFEKGVSTQNLRSNEHQKDPLGLAGDLDQTFASLRQHQVLDAKAFDFRGSPLFKGSGCFPKVGLKPEDVFRHTDSWIWAGEALSPLQSGTLHGAVETAKSVVRKYFSEIKAKV
jgi:hypothetical protein